MWHKSQKIGGVRGAPRGVASGAEYATRKVDVTWREFGG